MKFVLQRDRVLASTLGHSVAFKKGVPTYVPPELHAQVIEMGAEPETPLETEFVATLKEPDDPAERESAVFKVFEALVLRGRRGDFTAGNAPHIKVVSAELGWGIDARERDVLWDKFQQSRGA